MPLALSVLMSSWTGVSSLATTAAGRRLARGSFLAMAFSCALCRTADRRLADRRRGACGSVAERQAVLARIGAADQHAARRGRSRSSGRRPAACPLGTTRWPRRPAPRRSRRGTPALDLQLAAVGEGARRIERRLRVEAVIEEVGQQVGLADRLIVRRPSRRSRSPAAVLEGERRDDRVHRPLARRDHVGMRGVEREALPRLWNSTPVSGRPGRCRSRRRAS